MLRDPPTQEIIGDLEGDRAYTGFEISGLVHLGTGIISGIQAARLQHYGKRVVILLADWHTWINDKLGGDWNKIQSFTDEYFKPALERSFKVAGVDTDSLEWHKVSEIFSDDYWAELLRLSKKVTLSRVMRSITVLGREQSQSLDFAKFIYPLMQVTDQKMLEALIGFFGMDQRKTCVIAREILQIKGVKPSFVLHHLLLSLKGPGKKMSKSIPETALFVHDDEETIRKKIKKAYCPPTVEDNPVMELATHILVPLGKMEDPKPLFGREMGPKELKEVVADKMVELLAPVRKWYDGLDISEISITR